MLQLCTASIFVILFPIISSKKQYFRVFFKVFFLFIANMSWSFCVKGSIESLPGGVQHNRYRLITDGRPVVLSQCKQNILLNIISGMCPWCKHFVSLIQFAGDLDWASTKKKDYTSHYVQLNKKKKKKHYWLHFSDPEAKPIFLHTVYDCLFTITWMYMNVGKWIRTGSLWSSSTVWQQPHPGIKADQPLSAPLLLRF